MYPVGVLFGFGFDTASSIALLAISAIAKRDSDKRAIPSSHVVILPVRSARQRHTWFLVSDEMNVVAFHGWHEFP